MYPLITRDPVSGGELIVTRLECPESGIVIEGQFSLGWIGRLNREQLDFVEMLVKYRGNIQKLAAELLDTLDLERSRTREQSRNRTARVRVTNLATNRQKVNVTIPVSLIQVGLRLGTRLAPQVSGSALEDLLRAIEGGATGRLLD